MLGKVESFTELVRQHLTWYPLMEARDIYKLLYQGVMGSEHLISSAEEFIQYLRSEFDPLEASPIERIIEPVRPDGSLSRINLRAYKSHQLQLDLLIPALLETAQTLSGTFFDLWDVWMSVVQACEQGCLPNIEPDQVHLFTLWLEEHGFPAAHHSKVYTEAYQPAYRLIANEFIHEIGLGDAGYI
jgi:hypothetical protein